MYASPPSQTSLRPPAPLGCLLCAILVPSSAKSFEPFSSHCPLSLLFPHLPVQQLSSSLRMTCMPDAGFICLVSLSPAFDPGSTPSLLKFLVHVMCLPWSLCLTLSYTHWPQSPRQISPSAPPVHGQALSFPRSPILNCHLLRKASPALSLCESSPPSPTPSVSADWFFTTWNIFLGFCPWIYQRAHPVIK